ncbi:MAG: ROK family protein [Bryobacteraceae bacterium]
MAHGIGVLITERISVAAVSDHEVVGAMRVNPEDVDIKDSLRGLPPEVIVQKIVEEVRQLGLAETPSHIGVGMPGIVRNGNVEDSPNLVQFKGTRMQDLVTDAFRPLFGTVPVAIFNDADAMAAGIAAVRGHLDRLIRVWTLGTGIGYGRYPFQDGVWEAGHSVVTLDPKETYCGCGGKGHLEGIMGHRAMRLRFMDLEPDEIFEQAEAGETRCVEFVKLWHRALAAATATSIHLDGAGKFFVTGPNARFLNLTLLSEYLHEMVKLSPLQGYMVEVVPGGERVATIGAAVNAAQAAARV